MNLGLSEQHIGKEKMPKELDECLRLEDDDQSSSLCMDVWRKLSKMIISEVERLEKEDKNTDALARENEAHEKFGEDRIKDFVGREDILEVITAYIDYKSDDSHPLVIHGESGTGKTTLMIKAAEQVKGNCILRSIGATPEVFEWPLPAGKSMQGNFAALWLNRINHAVWIQGPCSGILRNGWH